MRSSLARESREDRAARRVSLRPASVCRASVCRERDDCEAPRPVLELARESRHPASATPRTTVSARRTRSRRDMGLVSGSGADCPLSIHMGVPPSVRMEQQESFRAEVPVFSTGAQRAGTARMSGRHRGDEWWTPPDRCPRCDRAGAGPAEWHVRPRSPQQLTGKLFTSFRGSQIPQVRGSLRRGGVASCPTRDGALVSLGSVGERNEGHRLDGGGS